jgi:hypothetical protein
MFRSLLLPPKSGFNKVKRLAETSDRQKCSAQKERALRNRPDNQACPAAKSLDIVVGRWQTETGRPCLAVNSWRSFSLWQRGA